MAQQTTEQLPVKTCNKCKELKPLVAFHNMKSSPDGKQYTCKVCMHKEGKRFRKDRPTYYYGTSNSYFSDPENREKLVQRIEDWRRGDTTKVYVIELPNRKLYVGSTTQNILARINYHVDKYRRYRNGETKVHPLLYNELDKYPLDKAVKLLRKGVQVLEEHKGRDRDLGRIREQMYIHKLDMKGYSLLNVHYNLCAS